MSNEVIPGSVNTGSPLISGPANPNVLPVAGQPQQQAEMVPKAQYDELFSKFGQMGNENGEYRQFFNDISPLLEKLDNSPELAKAILDEKFDVGLATAILEGRVSVTDANAIQAAAATVEKGIGTKAFNATSPEEIAKMIETQVNKVKNELEQKEELRTFEQKTADFIANTPDFSDHGDAISKWFDSHPDIVDVETAYYAVKGKMSAEDAAKKATQTQAEVAKEMAQNAAGGASVATHIQRGSSLVDQLIGGRSNPNVF